MGNKRVSKDQGEKKIGLSAIKPTETVQAEGIIEYLEKALGVTSTMLAGLIQVTERTLTNWRARDLEELENNSKSKRLVDLYDFVKQAESFKVKKSLLLNLLHEPIDPKNEDSSSILYYIVHDPASKLLKETAPLIIKRFLED
jgi:hypothetical protein